MAKKTQYYGPPEGYENVTLKVTPAENNAYMQAMVQMGAIEGTKDTFSSTCKFCDERNLQWRQVEGVGWKLYNAKGQQHKCEPF